MTHSQQDNEAWWRDHLVKGHRLEHLARRLFPLVPAAPRCKICFVPFAGFGLPLRFLGWSPSRKNPRLCTLCCERMPLGGAEVDIAVLFADIRNYTTLVEQMPGQDVATLMNRFYQAATQVLIDHDAIIDKLLGDSVMALFIPGVAGPGYREMAVRAGEALLRGVGYGTPEGPWLALGVGIHAGPAFVGNVGAEGVVDFTAIGDTVNVASRIQAQAAAGTILMSEAVHAAVAGRFGELAARALTIKGKQEPVVVRELRPPV
ncbi:MAG: adenylate/guanylate cyclase domain-containing protein [Nitrospirae bacterium]|nr:MAG: adenylate/guanylate cyclase domain-containing protein [Nitrospirota bacterium]